MYASDYYYDDEEEEDIEEESADTKYGIRKSTVNYFKSDEEKISFLQQVNLLGKSGKKRKPFQYKGLLTAKPVECNIIGYVTKGADEDPSWATLVVDYGGRYPMYVNSTYLKDMQSPHFVRNQSAEEGV